MHLCYHIWNPCSDHEQHEGRRPISLPAGHLTSAHTERMLPCPRRKVWDVAAPSLPRAVKLGEAAASFSLHFSVLPNFNVKENVGHFKSIGRQLFLTQRIMGFSTMNCTSSGRINFDFFFPHVFIYMWLYFHWYRIKSAFYWPCLLVLLLLMSSGTTKARAPVFLAKAERGLLGLMSKMQSYF